VRISYQYIRPLTVFYARSMGPYGTSVREAWEAMRCWLDKSKERTHVRQGYGLFRDSPLSTAPELLRYDACIQAIPGLDVDVNAGIARQVLAGGAYAVLTHVGSYDATGRVFSHLHRDLVGKHRLRIDGERPFLAVYLNDPQFTPEVHRRTEICVPVFPVCVPISANDHGVSCDVPDQGLRKTS
jgi:AraC family transcriptional regulator